jgi:predicted PurR-regulated permease PerM
MAADKHDLARTVLSVLCMAALTAASLWILRPFLPALIWATMIVVATWPVMLRVQKFLLGRRLLAIIAMSVALLLLFVLPLLSAIDVLASHTKEITNWVKLLQGLDLSPPTWVEQLPLVGVKLAEAWREITTMGMEELGQKLVPHSQEIVHWLLARLGSVSMIGLQLLLIVLLSAILFYHGETAAMGMRRFGRRLAEEHGEQTVILAGRAIRGVMLGIVVTALIQAALGGIGLAVAGVPFAAVLTVIMFMLAVAQIGVLPIMLAAVFWLYSTDAHGAATALLIWSIFVGTIDNVIRPILIKKGADLPLLLIFSGVIGGLLAFGLIGLFIGPVTLAVTYTLLNAWVDHKPPAAARSSKSP